ncbi:non-structural maintenance of chromosomes element 1 homolog [Sitophilus oryzae]|uniref:Non-structural maintenance of chromosomes element 1 homolog n=1 Tax=Sitophilus oryzae TaxID=7048 RepID=A0A6J2XB54_SITOR|nr:non-structural maintenance of chromosomes element 1 homolog [Sitophilus oryzae]
MNLKQKMFIQFMIKNGAATTDQALSFCQDSVENFVELKLFIHEINREISKQNFKIGLTTCEVSNQDFVLWLNTKNDDVSKLQITYSTIELEYFHVLMQEILISEHRRITYATALNITSSLTSNFTRTNGQTVLKKWFAGQYFIKENSYVYLGSRLITEFTTYLKIQSPDQICKLCSELVFKGRICASCDSINHSYCLDKYLERQNNCPSCSEEWTEKDDGSLYTQNTVVTQESAESNDEDGDEEQGRPVRKNRSASQRK